MKRNKLTRITAVTLLFLLSLIAVACGGTTQPAAKSETKTEGKSEAAAPAGDAVEINYVLWDSGQLPAYEACAAEFQKTNPNIKVKVTQKGWGDYWSEIQTGFVAGTAPDVFTNHLGKYPEFAAKGQLLDLQPLVDRDKVPTDVYITGLAELWTREGKRYGLPKDWDTVTVVYNVDMLEKAGIDPKIMETWTWNPKDGGTFEETIAKLTLDKNGKNALDPAFDGANVAQYGFIANGSGEASGQTQWSPLAVSNGFKFNDGPWDTKINYDDPKLAEAFQWWADLQLTKHMSPPYADVNSLGGNALFAAGKAAMLFDGSWMIGWYAGNTNFKFGFGKLPIGPEGRKTMFNGLADSIWVGSKHPEESWQWVKFLGSATCQNIVGSKGVVFPAIQSGVDNALKAYEAKKIDASAFTDEALDPKGTFLFPVVDHASEVVAIMKPAGEKIMLGQGTAADVLKESANQVNALFK